VFRLLRAIFKHLPALVREAGRIADALERLAPRGKEERGEVYLFMTDEQAIEAEAMRRAAWQELHGPLREGEIPPDDFQPETLDDKLRKMGH
jgi:hypothetical protein